MINVYSNNNNILLYRHKCFTGKYTTGAIHTKLHWVQSDMFSTSSLVRVLMMSFPAFILQTVSFSCR